MLELDGSPTIPLSSDSSVAAGSSFSTEAGAEDLSDDGEFVLPPSVFSNASSSRFVTEEGGVWSRTAIPSWWLRLALVVLVVGPIYNLLIMQM